MALPPSPYILSCTQCGWEKTFAPISDAVLPCERPTACPRCGHTAFKRKALSPLALLMRKISIPIK